MSWKVTPNLVSADGLVGVPWAQIPFNLKWTPASITTSLWLDAADAATVTTVSGNVSQWNDKSGNGRNATQATAASRPAYSASILNNLPGLVFDGSNDWLESQSVTLLPNPTTQYIFGLVSLINPTKGFGSLFMHSYASGQRNVGLQLNSDGTRIGIYSSSATTGYRLYGLPTGATVLCAVYQGASTPKQLLNVNGADSAYTSIPESDVSSSLAGTTGTYVIGRTTANYELSCTVHELVLIPSSNDQATYQKLEGYFAHKWGLTANLPNNHPYKTTVPLP